jgi:hypothetical protein
MFVQAWGILFFNPARNAGDGTPIRFSLPELNRDGLSLVRQSRPCYRDSDQIRFAKDRLWLAGGPRLESRD